MRIAGLATVPLSGISPGLGDSSQGLEVSATGSSAFFSGIAVAYTPGSTTATLTFSPAPNAFTPGPEPIQIIVADSGGTANGGVATRSRKRSWCRSPRSTSRPRSTPSALPATRSRAPSKTVTLTGIGDGPGDVAPTGGLQPLSVTATSSNPNVVNAIEVSYNSPGAYFGTLTLDTPIAGSITPGDSTTITVTVSDGNPTNGSIVRTFTVWYLPANPGPVVTPGPLSLGYTQGQAAQAIDPNVTVTDQGNPGLIASATVQIAENYVQGQDVLAYNNDPTGGLVTSSGFNAATGTLTLSAVPGMPVTPDIFSSALQAVTYSDQVPSPSVRTAKVLYTVTDNGSDNFVGTAIQTITISPLNHAPTLQVETVPAAATATLNGGSVGALRSLTAVPAT